MDLEKLSFRISLFNFWVAGMLGLLLRYLHVYEIESINYKYLLQAHSHFAMGGWVFTALFSASLIQFNILTEKNTLVYRKIFWLSQLGVYGMLFSFPFQGYALWSIIFSEIYVLATYWFAYRIWRELSSSAISTAYLKAALFFLVFSSLGPYVLGPMMVNHLAGSVWYYDAIYYYLHFQYNGWFIFTALALLFRFFENRRILLRQQQIFWGFILMVSGCVLTYSLSVLWSDLGIIFNIIGGAGASLQLAGVIVSVTALYSFFPKLKLSEHLTMRILIALSVLAFLVKITLQLISAQPSIAFAAYTYRNFVIAYMHLVFIGCIVFFLFDFFIREGLLQFINLVKTGFILLIFGFLTTEILLVVQSCYAWANIPFINNFDQYMLYLSIAMPLGAFLFIVSQIHWFKFSYRYHFK